MNPNVDGQSRHLHQALLNLLYPLALTAYDNHRLLDAHVDKYPIGTHGYVEIMEACVGTPVNDGFLPTQYLLLIRSIC